MYGLAGLCLIYLLKKDWKSYEILKKITDSYTQKIKEIETKNTEEHKLLLKKLEDLEKENIILKQNINNRREK